MTVERLAGDNGAFPFMYTYFPLFLFIHISIHSILFTFIIDSPSFMKRTLGSLVININVSSTRLTAKRQL